MKNSDKFKKTLSNIRIRFTLPPFLTYEINFDDFVNSKSVDERIEKLGEIKKDLQGAVEVIEELQVEALERKEEISHLQQTVSKLEEDKNAAEALVQVPEESFARLLDRASTKSRWRGIFEGLIIGFVTGTLSSLLIWYLTNN